MLNYISFPVPSFTRSSRCRAFAGHSADIRENTDPLLRIRDTLQTQGAQSSEISAHETKLSM